MLCSYFRPQRPSVSFESSPYNSYRDWSKTWCKFVDLFFLSFSTVKHEHTLRATQGVRPVTTAFREFVRDYWLCSYPAEVVRALWREDIHAGRILFGHTSYQPWISIWYQEPFRQTIFWSPLLDCPVYMVVFERDSVLTICRRQSCFPLRSMGNNQLAFQTILSRVWVDIESNFVNCWGEIDEWRFLYAFVRLNILFRCHFFRPFIIFSVIAQCRVTTFFVPINP